VRLMMRLDLDSPVQQVSENQLVLLRVRTRMAILQSLPKPPRWFEERSEHGVIHDARKFSFADFYNMYWWTVFSDNSS
jgi:hypothetical protein